MVSLCLRSLYSSTFTGIGRAAKSVWNNVIKPAAPKIVSAAGGIVGGLADKVFPGAGGVITDLTSRFSKNEDEVSDSNELVPRLRNKVRQVNFELK
jgi:hypothetical protein